MMMLHLLALDALQPSEIEYLCTQARNYKHARYADTHSRPLAGQTLALLFEKPSLRTRVSFEVAARELGAQTLALTPQEVGMGKRETIADIARVLSSYVHGVVLRTFDHAIAEEFATHASIPVINGLTDSHHPCQGLTDIFTVIEQIAVARPTIAYVGDGNNCAHSLMQAAAKLGCDIRIATPAGYAPDQSVLTMTQRDCARYGGSLTLTHDPYAAVAHADVIYTDVWTSMGQEAEADMRRAIFAPYQVNAALVEAAKPHVIVMHPLPAHRGEEITSDVIDGPHSRVFVQAENRLHMQKAILRMLMGYALSVKGSRTA